jgi:hypothetical protein
VDGLAICGVFTVRYPLFPDLRRFHGIARGGFEVFDDFPDKHVEAGLVRLFEALVSEAKDVETGLSPGDEFLQIHQPPTIAGLHNRLDLAPGGNHRPSIVSPAPGRYLNVGTERGLCSSFCSTRLGASCCGGSTCALQPLSNVRTTNQIDELNRTILSFPFTD